MDYRDIKKYIMAAVMEKKLEKDAPIDSIPVLTAKFQVSDKTVQKAINELKAEKILYSLKGKGVFVKDPSRLRGRIAVLKVAVMDIDAGRVLDKVNEVFARANADIQVIVRHFDASLPVENILDSFKPDVLLFEESNAHKFFEKRIFSELNFFSGDSTYGFLEKSCREGKKKLSAAPVLFSPIVIICNKEKIKERKLVLPWEWGHEEFFRIAGKLSSSRGGRRDYGFALSLRGNKFPAFITSFGVNYTDVRSSFSNLKKALAFFRRLMDEEICINIGHDIGIYDEYSLFFEGAAAMAPISYNSLRNHAKLTFEWDLMPLPKSGDGCSCFQVSYGGVLKDSPGKYPAEKYLETMLSHEVQKHIKEKCFLLPSLKEACEDNSIIPDAPPSNYNVYRKELFHMAPVTDFFRPEVRNVYQKELFLLINKMKSLDETCNSIREKLLKIKN